MAQVTSARVGSNVTIINKPGVHLRPPDTRREVVE